MLNMSGSNHTMLQSQHRVRLSLSLTAIAVRQQLNVADAAAMQ